MYDIINDKAAGRCVLSRRRRGPAGTQTVSFTFHPGTLTALRALVERGEVDNASAFVEESVTRRLRELVAERRTADYGLASADPAFRAELEETARAFRHADADLLRTDGDD